MVTDSAKTLALVISAIKNLREQKGSSSQEILHYLSSVYDIPQNVARRQMQTALKRGVAYGILKKDGGHYVLPITSDAKCQEIATQELNLLDYCRMRGNQLKGNLCCKCKRARSRRRRRKKKCSCKKRKRSRRRRSRRRSRGCKKRRRRKKKCKCGGRGGRRRAQETELARATDQLAIEKPFAPEVEAKESVTSGCSSVESTVSSTAS